MDSGKLIRELREERCVKSSDIERMSRAIADVRGNPDYYVSHSTLADVEGGSVPSIHQLFSLAVCLKASLEDLLLVSGMDANEVRELAGPPAPPCPGPSASDPQRPGFRFQLNFEADFNSHETSLLRLNPQELASLP